MIYLITVILAATLMGQDDPQKSTMLHRDLYDFESDMASYENGQLTLINGRPARAGEYPATVYSRQGGARCTATLIGERVLLHAAHCMNNNGAATFTIGGKQYASVCTHHPSYRRNSTADWALCLVSQPVSGVVFEKLASKGLSKGDQVRLTGYGCTRPGGGGGNDGILRVGDTNVVQIPSGTNYDTVTRQGSALCFGDSGGPAFIYRDGGREVFGVNSRGDIRTTSYLSSTYVGQFQSFAKDWAASKNVKICGVHTDAANCRGGSQPDPEPEPEPEPQPEMSCWTAYERLGFCMGIKGIPECLVLANKIMSCVM